MATHQFDVAFSVQHQILGLQVSVEDTFTMEVLKSLGDAADAEFGCGFFKTSPEIKTDSVFDPVRPLMLREEVSPTCL